MSKGRDSYVRRHYGTRQGRRTYTWSVVVNGETIAKSARSYTSSRAIDRAILKVRTMLGWVEAAA